MTRVLFVHQNFPGQFGPILQTLRRAGGFELAAIGQRASAASDITYCRYVLDPRNAVDDPTIAALSRRVAAAKAVADQAKRLKSDGYSPDVILVHAGWGEGLFLRDVFPRARIICYCEYYYHRSNEDLTFDPEFSSPDDLTLHRLRGANAFTLATLDDADIGVAPTQWQRATFPSQLQSKIVVLHEGVAEDCFTPQAAAPIRFHETGAVLSPGDPVVTFVTRTLEPYRGYHVLARALPELLARVPKAQVVIVGRSTGGYGPPPGNRKNWRDIFWSDVAGQLDQSRVHFSDWLPRPAYLNCLRVSRVHAYLTYPFVVSWSLIEAMAVGCTIAASDTAPVREFLEDDVNARLVPFFDRERWIDTLDNLLSDEVGAAALGKAARNTVIARGLRHHSTAPRWLALMRGGDGT